MYGCFHTKHIYFFNSCHKIKQVKGFLKEINPTEVQRVVVFNPWTENVYVVVTEKYNFSFKFTIKQFTQMNEIFKQLNKGEEIEHKWY